VTSTPMLSVVMPVYNNAPYLDSAIASVLNQSFRDFEFVVLDNGSQDASVEILRRWAARDDRIRLIEEPEPLGIAGSSNAATRHARAELIARMDADDVSLPQRFARELGVISGRPDVVLVGAMSEGVDGRGHVVRPPDRWFLLRPGARPPFVHGTIVYRRDAFERIGGYRAEAGSWADLDFIQRLGQTGEFAVLAEALYQYRFTATSTTSGASVRQAIESHAERRRTVNSRVGRPTPPAAEVAAAALYEREAMRLWAGQRPALLQALVNERLVRPTPRGLVILAWAVSAAVCPRILRRAIAAMLRLRDRLARWRLGSRGDGEVLSWRFG
jgi:glycosyltransferase involved in cell wall biosynthesis